MLVKLGVDISRLKRPMRRGLKKIDSAFLRHTDFEAVVTSTYDGNHSPSSLHYAHLAVDLRLPAETPFISNDIVKKELKSSLGKDFDVILERNHFHIEYDPKEKS